MWNPNLKITDVVRELRKHGVREDAIERPPANNLPFDREWSSDAADAIDAETAASVKLTELERQVLIYLIHQPGDPLKDIGQDGTIDTREAYAAIESLRQRL